MSLHTGRCEPWVCPLQGHPIVSRCPDSLFPQGNRESGPPNNRLWNVGSLSKDVARRQSISLRTTIFGAGTESALAPRPGHQKTCQTHHSLAHLPERVEVFAAASCNVTPWISALLAGLCLHSISALHQHRHTVATRTLLVPVTALFTRGSLKPHAQQRSM